MSASHLDNLRVRSQYIRQRYDRDNPKAYGQPPATPALMRKLENATWRTGRSTPAPRGTGAARSHHRRHYG
jgi:hypothetical protein